MRPKHTVIRKSLASGLLTLLLGSSVVGPLIERTDFTQGSAVESEHDPTTCPPAHDHTICTQIGANLSITSASISVDPTHPVVRAGALAGTRTPVGSVFLDGHRSRAPPSA